MSWSRGLDKNHHIFNSVVACISGFRGQDRANIREEIVRGGGAVTPKLTANCTHLITSELRGNKCWKAMDMEKISIVPREWVQRSVDRRCMEQEYSFCAHAPLTMWWRDLTMRTEAPLMMRTSAPPIDSLSYHWEQVYNKFLAWHPFIFFSCPRSLHVQNDVHASQTDST